MKTPRNSVPGLVAVLGTLTGCASMFTPVPFVPRAEVIVQSSEFERDIELVGIDGVYSFITVADGSDPVFALANPYGEFFLRSWVNPESQQITHQLYVALTYLAPDWQHWFAANTEAAEALEVTDLGAEVASCSTATRNCRYSETVGVAIPHATLLRFASGLRVKLYAQVGREGVIELSEGQVAAQLAAVARALAP